ncbi:hypothetical protein OROMI_017317 [Orobanche minor]
MAGSVLQNWIFNMLKKKHEEAKDVLNRALYPKIEIRFRNLNIETYVHVGSRALPTITDFIVNMTEAFLRQLKICKGNRRKLAILDDVSRIIRPSRMTLLLGPPSSGKTTLMLALAGYHLQAWFEGVCPSKNISLCQSVPLSDKFIQLHIHIMCACYRGAAVWRLSMVVADGCR